MPPLQHERRLGLPQWLPLRLNGQKRRQTGRSERLYPPESLQKHENGADEQQKSTQNKSRRKRKRKHKHKDKDPHKHPHKHKHTHKHKHGD